MAIIPDQPAPVAEIAEPTPVAEIAAADLTVELVPPVGDAPPDRPLATDTPLSTVTLVPTETPLPTETPAEIPTETSTPTPTATPTEPPKDWAFSGVRWAGDHKFDVTNNSYFADPWLFNCRNEAEQRAIRYAMQRG